MECVDPELCGKDGLYQCGCRSPAPPTSRGGSIEELARSFIATVEAASRHAESRGKGGQHVPYMDDFSVVTPGTMSSLKRWARDFKTVLDAPLPPPTPFYEEINLRMADRGLTRTEFAQKLRVALARVSNTLKPDWNPTWKTMVRYAGALGYDLRIEWYWKRRS